MKERCGWQNGMKLPLLTSHASVCLQHHDGRIRVSRHHGERMLNSCVMHHQPGSPPVIMVWGGIGYHSRTPVVRIAGSLNSQRYISEVLEPVALLYLQDLVATIFQQDNAQPRVSRIVQSIFVSHQTELVPCPAHCPDLWPIENMWSIFAQRLPRLHPQLPHQINFGNVWKLLGQLYPRNTYKVALNQCRRVWQCGSPTMAATLATGSGRNHTAQKSVTLII
ncbi:hypothetical protein TNCV_1937751 [Trichonephila clavipes]|nr:hypothetical protein TNCV_1937751 [Trichonephila clavipes]